MVLLAGLDTDNLLTQPYSVGIQQELPASLKVGKTHSRPSPELPVQEVRGLRFKRFEKCFV
jgi:hypothetical protein